MAGSLFWLGGFSLMTECAAAEQPISECPSGATTLLLWCRVVGTCAPVAHSRSPASHQAWGCCPLRPFTKDVLWVAHRWD